MAADPGRGSDVLTAGARADDAGSRRPEKRDLGLLDHTPISFADMGWVSNTCSDDELNERCMSTAALSTVHLLAVLAAVGTDIYNWRKIEGE